MRRILLPAGVVAAVSLGFTMIYAQGGPSRFRANLAGTQEIPVVSTEATGTFHATLQAGETELAWELEYAGLSGPASQAHIHFAQPFANGGIVIWLCGSAAFPGPPNTPFCPAGTGGKVTGVAKAVNVVPATAQGIAADEFAEVIQAIRQGNAYANVHTDQSKGGEIRGQIRRGSLAHPENNDENDNDGENNTGNGKGRK